VIPVAAARPRIVASLVPGLALLAAVLTGCATAQVTGARQVGTASPAPAAIVYVTDFELDAHNVRSERGILPPPPLPGLGGMLRKSPGAPSEPAARADGWWG